VAIAVEQANAQHYETPAEFFQLVLGPRLKYSCGLFENGNESLAQAEEAMLHRTCQRAEIADGMDLLDLGCGWGSLTLWIAERYPRCTVTAVSNSHSQRRFIEARCQERGLDNVRVRTANVADITLDEDFDRIVSVEMLEHVRNYETLFARAAGWLRPGGKLFAHIFCHRSHPYAFETDGDGDWMARHFFTGGIMPSFNLFDAFSRDLAVFQRWQVNGRHYAQTCEHWLANLDTRRAEAVDLFARDRSAAEARLAVQRWRIFFMACAELFAYAEGTEWIVGHYLLEPTRVAAPLATAGALT
jgi:cyclopropane-fatty-acyl-phospholipid synthase